MAAPLAPPAAVESRDPSWLTAVVRPAGLLDRRTSSRLRDLLTALSASASLVVVDLEAATLRGRSAAVAIERAACALEARGGCLLCVNADDGARREMAAVGDHAVLVGV